MLKRVILGMNIMLITCTLLSYASPYIDPSSIAITSLLGLIFPYLFILNLVFIVFWLFVKWQYSLYSIAILFLGLPIIFKFFGTASSANDIVASDNYKFVTYNMQSSLFSRTGNRETAKVLDKKLVGFMQQIKHIDVFCGQELSTHSKNTVQRAYNLIHKHSYKDRATAIYSRYPIVNAGQVDFGTKTNSCVWADIDFPEETVRVYCVHLQSNNITIDTEKVIEKGDFQSSGTWKNVGSIFKKYARSSIIRSKQVQKIIEHKSKSPHKVIVSGDFNDTPQSYVYSFLAKGMKDTFIEKGSGLGTSYGGAIPGLRIDYILADPEIKILKHKILKEKYSDHYPIIAILGLD